MSVILSCSLLLRCLSPPSQMTFDFIFHLSPAYLRPVIPSIDSSSLGTQVVDFDLFVQDLSRICPALFECTNRLYKLLPPRLPLHTLFRPTPFNIVRLQYILGSRCRAHSLDLIPVQTARAVKAMVEIVSVLAHTHSSSMALYVDLSPATQESLTQSCSQRITDHHASHSQTTNALQRLAPIHTKTTQTRTTTHLTATSMGTHVDRTSSTPK